MRVAVIGSGGIAQRHLQVLVTAADVEVVGHVTRTRRHAEESARRWGGHPYTDYRDLLERERVEVAWVCVPPDAHGDIERALIERDIPFLVEKPLDADGRTAITLAESIAVRGLVVGVGYHWRAMDSLDQARRVLTDHPPRLILGLWFTATPSPVWWRRQASSGGQMVEQVTHLVDLARFLVGEAQVVSSLAVRHDRPAYPDADIADATAAILHFANGAVGSFAATCVLARSHTVQLQLLCEQLALTVTPQGIAYDSADDCREVACTNDPFLSEDLIFLQAVRNGDASGPLSTYADAVRSHRLAWSILEASSTDGAASPAFHG